MNLCRACDQDFSSLTGFDPTRIGSDISAYDHSPEHPNGRRCLTETELLAKGMHLDRFGRWRMAGKGTPPWRRDVRAVRSLAA